MSEQADIEAALARATAAYKNVRAELDALKDANDRAEAAEAENDRLREALKPFAEYMDGGKDLDFEGLPVPDDQVVGWVYLTYGDFRRARAALAKEAGQ